MATSVFSVNRALSNQLFNLLQAGDTVRQNGALLRPRPTVVQTLSATTDVAAPLNVVVTLDEVNNQHGTGPLVERVCRGWPNVFAIRARNDYGGMQEFGDWQVCMQQYAQTRPEFFESVLSVLRGRNVAAILCVPFAPDDFLTSIAVQEVFNARLCAYVMDDQNVATDEIPDDLMREFLERCSLRLATHPELRYAYESKYHLPFHLLPAVVPASLVAKESTLAPEPLDGRPAGALIGSFWHQRWFDRLCDSLGGSGWDIDWFGNNRSPWIDFAPSSLARARIKPHGVIAEPRLAQELKRYPFVIVPVGELGNSESHHGVARLSLPGRILFAVATSHTPVLIVGSSETCGARFVTHFGVGEVVPYDSRKIADAMNRMNEPETQARLRQRSAQIAATLSDDGVGQWLMRSIELEEPADDRFEALFNNYDAVIDLAH